MQSLMFSAIGVTNLNVISPEITNILKSILKKFVELNVVGNSINHVDVFECDLA